MKIIIENCDFLLFYKASNDNAVCEEEIYPDGQISFF